MSGIGNTFYAPSSASDRHLTPTDLVILDFCGSLCDQADRAGDDLAFYDVVQQIQRLVPDELTKLFDRCPPLDQVDRIVNTRVRGEGVLNRAQIKIGRDLKELSLLNAEMDRANDISSLQNISQQIQNLDLRNKLQRLNAGAHREDVAERFLRKCNAKIGAIGNQWSQLSLQSVQPTLLPTPSSSPSKRDLDYLLRDFKEEIERAKPNREALEQYRGIPEALIEFSNQLMPSDPTRGWLVYEVVNFWVSRWLDTPVARSLDTHRSELVTQANEYLTRLKACSDTDGLYNSTVQILAYLDAVYEVDIAAIRLLCVDKTNLNIRPLLGGNFAGWQSVKKPQKQAKLWDECSADIGNYKTQSVDSPESAADVAMKLLRSRACQYAIARAVAEDLGVVGAVNSL